MTAAVGNRHLRGGRGCRCRSRVGSATAGGGCRSRRRRRADRAGARVLYRHGHRASAAFVSLLPSPVVASRNSRSRRCGAPMSDARRHSQLVSYPSAARSAWTPPSACAEGGDVFHKDDGRSKSANSVSDACPQVAVDTGDAGTFAGVGDVLAGEACGEDVDGWHVGPVDGADVPEVGHVGPVVGADGGGMPVGFGVPGELAAEHQLDGHVEAAVSGAQGSDARCGSVVNHAPPPRRAARAHRARPTADGSSCTVPPRDSGGGG